MSELKSEKITIFKEVFNYYYDGDITKEQLADLLLLHYETRWGDGVEVKDIQDKDVRMIWRTLQHTVVKSVRNAKDYENRKSNKTNDLKPSEPVVEQIPQPVENKPVESLKMTNNDNREIPAEFAIDEPVKENKPVMENYSDILPNGVVIPRNLFLAVDNYIRLDKKDRVKGLNEYEETEKEEYIESINKQLKASGYSTEDIDDIAFAVVCRREEELAA